MGAFRISIDRLCGTQRSQVVFRIIPPAISNNTRIHDQHT